MIESTEIFRKKNNQLALQLKRVNLAIAAHVSGSICAQWVRCGKARCKCVYGELHGPYYYYFTRIKGVQIKRYIQMKNISRARQVCNSRRAESSHRCALRQLNKRQSSLLISRLRDAEKSILSLKEKTMSIRSQTKEAKNE